MIPAIHLRPVIVQSPNHDVTRTTTAGVVIHSTRGGRPPGLELVSTINWLLSPTSQVSAHAVIGRTGALWDFLPASLAAWHARELNNTHLAIEFEQGLPGDPFTEEQYCVGAYVVRDWARAFGFPIDRQSIVGHDETGPGRRDGKSDPGPLFDWDRFIGLCGDVRLALPDSIREYASAQYGDLLDAANSLLGIARFNDERRRAGLLAVEWAVAELRKTS